MIFINLFFAQKVEARVKKRYSYFLILSFSKFTMSRCGWWWKDLVSKKSAFQLCEAIQEE